MNLSPITRNGTRSSAYSDICTAEDLGRSLATADILRGHTNRVGADDAYDLIGSWFCWEPIPETELRAIALAYEDRINGNTYVGRV